MTLLVTEAAGTRKYTWIRAISFGVTGWGQLGDRGSMRAGAHPSPPQLKHFPSLPDPSGADGH